MKKALLILSVLIVGCQKKAEVQPAQPVITNYIVDIEPTNYNTIIIINNVEQNPVQGAQQFNLKTGDSIYVYALDPQWKPTVYFHVKVNGILLYQSNQNSQPQFGYKAK